MKAVRVLWSLVLVGLLASSSSAATLLLTKTVDSDDGVCDADCSLRKAIAASNATPEPDTIVVPHGLYALTLGRLDLLTDSDLEGSPRPDEHAMSKSVLTKWRSH